MGSFRRFVIGATDLIAIAAIVGITIVSAVVGAAIGGVIDSMGGGAGRGALLGPVLGGIAGFLSAAMAASVAVSASQTAVSTRQVARDLARIAAGEPDDGGSARSHRRHASEGSVTTPSRLSAEAAFLAIVGGIIWMAIVVRNRGMAIFDPVALQVLNVQLALAVLILGLLAAGTASTWPAFAGILMLAGAGVLVYGTLGAAPVYLVAIGSFVLGAILAFVAAYRKSEPPGL
jgi:hypothetical protein